MSSKLDQRPTESSDANTGPGSPERSEVRTTKNTALSMIANAADKNTFLVPKLSATKPAHTEPMRTPAAKAVAVKLIVVAMPSLRPTSTCIAIDETMSRADPTPPPPTKATRIRGYDVVKAVAA